ncbi:hypothetical protein H257_05387 [Aphanomyces astaci]|uniref:Uncharacterized protein n=1 Tax=Aphanomyces astaci TaxID=112090 RepID=W4GQ29_APHAT|nr:hypothetical protein H257_05387 [Aphanomyces astaci]ETV81817.1 hypothetical protein H257_05387 [Aphanomyces astaci]|eukprot:XP_009828554.1 hypothetical protein H257_05387 [Aphanomyces astaci]
MHVHEAEKAVSREKHGVAEATALVTAFAHGARRPPRTLAHGHHVTPLLVCLRPRQTARVSGTRPDASAGVEPTRGAAAVDAHDKWRRHVIHCAPKTLLERVGQFVPIQPPIPGIRMNHITEQSSVRITG